MADKNCCNCYYYQGGSDMDLCCNYIFIEDQKRPCPPGKDCTVKRPRKRRRKLNEERKRDRQEKGRKD